MTKKRRVRLKAANVPKSIEVLGRQIKILIKDLNLSPEDALCYGECLGMEQTILIDRHHPNDLAMINSTLFHESVHMVLHMTGLSELMHAKDEHLEEALVCALENAYSNRINLMGLQPPLSNIEKVPNVVISTTGAAPVTT